MYKISLREVSLETQSCRPTTKLLVGRLVTQHGIDYNLHANLSTYRWKNLLHHSGHKLENIKVMN